MTTMIIIIKLNIFSGLRLGGIAQLEEFFTVKSKEVKKG